MKVLTENTAEKKEENAVTELLNAYLEKAVAVSAGHKRTDANGLIRECYERLIKEGVGEEDLLKAAGEKEKALKEQASKFSLQAKLNYLTNADRKKEEIKGENIVFNGMGGAFIGVAVTMGTMMASMYMYIAMNRIQRKSRPFTRTGTGLPVTNLSNSFCSPKSQQISSKSS